MLHTMSETVIVAALKRGNLRRAVELILDTYQDEIYGYCASLVGSAEAGTVYQQVLVTALEELPTFNGVVSIRAWLYAVARRVVLRFQQEASTEPAPSLPAAPDEVPGLRPTDVELESCFSRVSSESREILQLALWHGLLLSEAAHVTGRSLPEARRLAADGLSILAGELQRTGGQPS
jgi:DNA-directed RNA polymerase specialized sigma24 family protein